MADSTIAPELIEQLELLAEREKRTLDDLLRDMLTQYVPPQSAQDDALERFIGMFDDDVTDMSTSVRETMAKFYQDRHGGPD